MGRSDTDGGWALGDPERVVNFGHAAVHRVTATAKAAVKARYGARRGKAYFAGLLERRPPGADVRPAVSRRFRCRHRRRAGAGFSAIIATFLAITRAIYPDPSRVDTPGAVDAGPAGAAQGGAGQVRCLRRPGRRRARGSGDVRVRSARSSPARRATRPGACRRPRSRPSRRSQTGPMLDGKPYHVGFPYGAEGLARGGWGHWLVGRGRWCRARPAESRLRLQQRFPALLREAGPDVVVPRLRSVDLRR